jgi:hypothetical protein
MRKFVLAIFILFYATSVVGTTMERTENWAAERAQGIKHQRSGGHAGITESHKRSPHQVQTKWLQDGSGLVSSFVRSSDPPYSETALHQLLAGFPADQNGRTISSRAPPVLL